MEIEGVKYRLALRLIEGVGNTTCCRLIERFGSARNIFSQSARDLMRVDGVSPQAAEAISVFRNWDRVKREIETALKHNVAIITMDDPSYPQLLRSIYDPPSLLFVKGHLISDQACIAVVGSRRAGTYGRYTTGNFCRDLARRGIVIVSGMARGIDSAAHRGALSADGRTVAVLGSGIDVVYPPENGRLFEEIAETGAVVSEYPFGTPPIASNFPSRNRIISGMSLGVLVMEATEKSGSLITARLALEQGREVFAVPGSIDQPGSKGTHRLIREGAKLVERVEDVLEEIALRMSLPESTVQGALPEPDSSIQNQTVSHAGPREPLDQAGKKILAALSGTAMHIDEIISTTGLPGSEALGCLLRLELMGYIEQLPGKVFRKVSTMTI